MKKNHNVYWILIGVAVTFFVGSSIAIAADKVVVIPFFSGTSGCPEPLLNCNGNCVDSNNDPNNCKTCNNSCSSPVNVATAYCSNANCIVLNCESGYANCDSVSGNGCEISLSNDPTNCGACDNVCPGGRSCTDGTCETSILTLENDSHSGGGGVSFSSGFITGEAGASTLGPVSDNSLLQSVQLLFGGSTASQTVTLRIYEDFGTDTPGTLLYIGDYEMTGSNTALAEIDLTLENITLTTGTSLRIALFFHHNGFPSIGNDSEVGSLPEETGFTQMGTG